jgi:hypothetical protein
MGNILSAVKAGVYRAPGAGERNQSKQAFSKSDIYADHQGE